MLLRCCRRYISSSSSKLDPKDLILSPSVKYEKGNKTLLLKGQKSVLVITGTYPEENNLKTYLKKFGEIESFQEIKTGSNYNFLVEFLSDSSIKLLRNEMSGEDLINRVVKLSPTGSNIANEKCRNAVEDDKEFLMNEMRKKSNVYEQMMFLMNLREMSSSEILLRYFVISLVNEVIAKTHLGNKYKAKLYPFGSGVSGIGQHHSDIDLAVFVKHAENCAEILEEIGRELSSHMPLSEEFEFYPDARVPVLKFNFKPIQLNVDVTVQPDWDAHEILICLNWYCRHNPNFRLLVYTLRYWAKDFLHHGFGGHWTPFLFNCLVMFYLMRLEPQQLPSMRNVLKMKNTDYVCDNSITMEKLLLGFFSYYRKFDFRRQKINIAVGTIANNPTGCFYIEHPFIPGRNMASNVSYETVMEFKSACAEAADQLQMKAGIVDTQKNWGVCLLLQEQRKQRIKL